MRVLLAIGGNSIERPGDTGSADEQLRVLRRTMDPVAGLVGQGHQLILTHGNGPQVGRALQRTEATAAELGIDPLHICGAETQGRLGFLIVQALSDALAARGLRQPVVAMITRVVVSPDDPEFLEPTKPVGFFYTPDRARELVQRVPYRMREDAGRGYRRVVPSPAPLRVLEEDTIRRLVDTGHLVVCCGGGGIPVVQMRPDLHVGVDAVIDKDRVSALLARALGVDRLVMTTSVDRIALDWKQPTQRALDRMTVSEARRYLAEGQFPAGSMGPKVEAMLDYLAAVDGEGLATGPDRLIDAFDGRTGTRIIRDPTG